MISITFGFSAGLMLSAGIGNLVESFQASLMRDMATWSAVIVAAIAGYIAYGAYKEQVESKRISLWRSLTEEWDHKMQKARVACIQAPPSKLGERYPRIMNFFETLGYLVKQGEVQEEFAQHSFSYYFCGYFKCAYNHIVVDHEKDRTIWENVFWLRDKWKIYELTKTEYTDFYDEEMHLLDRDT